MKKVSMVLLALIGFFGVSAGARAQEGTVIAKIPYEFVAGRKTFPAGTYTVTRVSSDGLSVFQIRNHETSENTEFLLPVTSDVAVDQPRLTFKRIGDTYYLGRIATLAGVYILATPKEEASLGAAKRPETASFAGAN